MYLLRRYFAIGLEEAEDVLPSAYVDLLLTELEADLKVVSGGPHGP